MGEIITEIVGAVSDIGTEFLAPGSVLLYAVGFSVVSFIWRRVAKAIRR